VTVVSPGRSCTIAFRTTARKWKDPVDTLHVSEEISRGGWSWPWDHQDLFAAGFQILRVEPGPGEGDVPMHAHLEVDGRRLSLTIESAEAIPLGEEEAQ
jgi:hypothetical protein